MEVHVEKCIQMIGKRRSFCDFNARDDTHACTRKQAMANALDAWHLNQLVSHVQVVPRSLITVEQITGLLAQPRPDTGPLAAQGGFVPDPDLLVPVFKSGFEPATALGDSIGRASNVAGQSNESAAAAQRASSVGGAVGQGCGSGTVGGRATMQEEAEEFPKAVAA
jgi:hypothetical protein